MANPSLRFRTGLAAGLLLLSFVVVLLISRGYQHSIRPLQQPLEQLPVQLGDWYGVDQPTLDPRTVGVLGADEVLGRQYTNQIKNESLALHIAAWTKPMEIPDPAPHHPEACYTGAGFEVVDRKIDTFETTNGKLRVELIRYRQADLLIATAHWFQIGDQIMLNKSEGRKAHQSLWGKPEWPSTIKVLVHLDNVQSLEALHAELQEFIPLVYAWTSQLDASESHTADDSQLASHVQ